VTTPKSNEEKGQTRHCQTAQIFPTSFNNEPWVFLVPRNLEFLTKMTNSKKMYDNHKKECKTTSKKGRQPKKKWKTIQSTKINLIGCEAILN
jgi:hypothetical protein